jgi:hypothetical protein
MPEVENIIFDDIDSHVSGHSTIASILDPEPRSLDNLEHTSVPYRHPHHRNNGNHDFISLKKRHERKNHGTIPTASLPWPI